MARGILETTDANSREIVEIQREFKDELAQWKNVMFRTDLVLWLMRLVLLLELVALIVLLVLFW